MHEPPADLADETLRDCLAAQYGLDVATVSFLPWGHDAWAWVYRVEVADGTLYFLKVRKSVTNEPGLLVPRYLHDHGVTQVIAPLPAADGSLWAAVTGYALILYPFVAGTPGMEHGLTDAQWRAYGAVLRQIHATPVAPELAALMRRETFVPYGAALVRDAEARMEGQRVEHDPPARDLVAFWREYRPTIQTLVARAEALGRRLAAAAPPFVLCHADFHTANVLLDADGQLWIVDWDETVVAPIERDLMFVVGGGISRAWVRPRDEEVFLEGYGPAAIDPVALAYYRYGWAVSDIGEYAMQVLARPDLGAVSRQAGLDIFKTLFQPGEIVALALEVNP